MSADSIRDRTDVGGTTAAEERSSYGVPPEGFRLPDATRIGRVRLQIADLERSLAFYVQVLGLHVLEQRRGFAALAPHGEDQALIELHERPGAAASAHRSHLGLFHYAILLPDRAALGRFVAHLATVGARAGASDHLVSEALYLQDPDGLGIEVYADRPRSSWQRQGRELAIATQPLDLRSVVASSGGETWSGMPAGTVIGHVHLHVGDLDRAAEFYHGGLGMDKVVWSYPGALFLSAGGYHHHLGVNTWAGPTAAPPRDDDARLLEWELVVPTEDAAAAVVRSLESAGHRAERGEHGWLAADPWGTPLRILADAAR